MRNNMYGVASEYVAPTSAFSDSPCFRAICRRSVPSSISTAVVICCHVVVMLQHLPTCWPLRQLSALGPADHLPSFARKAEVVVMSALGTCLVAQ
jgi:hypothetical protein